jgi:hypothetical protein
MPSFFSFLPARIPGVSEGTTKAACTRWPRLGSTLATTTRMSATPPLVAKIFWPFRTHSPPLRLAVVRSADTSEPAFGSVTHSAPTLGSSGVPNMRGAHLVSCSGVPL